MKIRYPLAFEIIPQDINTGRKWVTARIKNIGKKKLLNLEIRLNSHDTFAIKPIDEHEYVYELNPNEQTKIPFQIEANTSTTVFMSVESMTDEGEPLFIESPAQSLSVGDNPAEIQSMFAITEPYPVPKETIRCESTIQGIKETDDLNLEFWAETPEGNFDQLATMNTKKLNPGEIAKYSAEITPEDEGLYRVHAYLDDGNRRLDHKTDMIYVKKENVIDS